MSASPVTRSAVSVAKLSEADRYFIILELVLLAVFFLTLGAAPHLDGQYSAFGRITEGMDVLEAFEKEEVDGETPKRRLEIIEAKVE